MNAEILQKLYKTRHVEIQVIGNSEGDFVIAVNVTASGTTLLLSDKTVEQPKRFKTPDYVITFLESLNIQRYSINLKNWDSSKMFDRHKRAHELRQFKSNVA